MKFKLKQYKNKISLKLFEKYYILNKRRGRWWERFLEKGHEKMTIMLIPHNEKKIFNFQISKFTISFFTFLFLIIVGISVYSWKDSYIEKSKERRLLTKYNDIRYHIARFEQLTEETEELIDDIKPEIEELYELASGNDDTEQLWQLGNYEDEEEAKLASMQEVVPSKLSTLKNIQKDMNSSINTLETVKAFITQRSNIVNLTPSRIPNQGHITSLFGWRRSPFGHGRDFHTGIDIAASGGTPIRATATGTVMIAGWSGGYGKMVRIKHDYGFETIYGHCRGVSVQAGQRVQRGQLIGYVGMTGNATGNHCHYEIRIGGNPINPYPYMSKIW